MIAHVCVVVCGRAWSCVVVRGHASMLQRCSARCRQSCGARTDLMRFVCYRAVSYSCAAMGFASRVVHEDGGRAVTVQARISRASRNGGLGGFAQQGVTAERCCIPWPYL